MGHRRRRVGVIRLVARVAQDAGHVVIVVNVTIRTCARRDGVRTSQRESSSAVIKRGIEPGACAVALVAGLREVRRDVIRIRRSLEVLQVTAHAGGGVEAVVVVDVAIGAGARRHGVQPGEREAGAGMVERRVQPVGGVVTGVASLWEIRSDVIGIRCSLEILQVTAHTGGSIQSVVVIDVAVGADAWRNGVQSGQGKAGGRVIKRGVGPQHGIVALLAGRWEAGMGHRRRRVVVVGLVATDARDNRDVVIVVDVTIGALAWRNRMRASEREA